MKKAPPGKNYVWAFLQKIIPKTKKVKMFDWNTASITALFAGSSVVIGLSVLWALMGLAAFIYSLVCMGKTPSLPRAILGVLMAVLFGPLYFIYWYFDPEYCRGARRVL